MSIIQKQNLRYLRRQNLTEEAAVLGNYYRDIIRSFGVDAHYYKLNLENFKTLSSTIVSSDIIRHGYGYEHQPEYSLSTDVITYAMPDSDIFQLSKFGLNRDETFTLYFDRIDFACAFAPELGRFKEYSIKPVQISAEVSAPEFYTAENPLVIAENLKFFGKSSETSASLLEYSAGYDFEEHRADMVLSPLSGDFRFPANAFLQKTFDYVVENSSEVSAKASLDWKVTPADSKYVLTGTITGSELMYDLTEVGNFVHLIHPDVGDVVTIDFPENNAREQLEITEAVDKDISENGLNPLLHKYVWRCKARRYRNEYETMEENQDNEETHEKLRYDTSVQEAIAKEISRYADHEDEVYGGYENRFIDEFSDPYSGMLRRDDV